MITLEEAHTVLITMPGTQEKRHHLKDLTDDKAKMCNNESVQFSEKWKEPKENIFKN